MYKSILVPVDLADLEIAAPAIASAVRLAEWTGAALRLVNIQQTLPALYMDYVPPEFDAEQRQSAESEMKGVQAKVALPQERVSRLFGLAASIRKFLRRQKSGALISL